MAPPKKKNVNSPQTNTGRKRVIKEKKEKKVLKKPTVIKIKLSSLQQKGSDSSTSKNTKSLNLQRKIELANEVALSQLCKDAEIVESVSSTLPVSKPVKKKKEPTDTSKNKNTRGKKPSTTISDFFKNKTSTDAGPNITQGNTEETPKKKPNKKKTVPKTPKGKTLKPQIKSADTTAPKKRERSVKNNTPIVMARSRTLRSNKVMNNVAEEVATLPAQTEAAKPGPALSKPTTPAVAMRASSATSLTSNMSWTRDISSSSTITCLTVGSHDTVRIDRRLPLVQLQHIDRSLHRLSLSDSSTDSESHSDSVASKPDEDDDDHDLFDAEAHCSSELVSDRLNLSLSSSTDGMDDVTLQEITSLIRQIEVDQENLESVIDQFGPESPSKDTEKDFSNILSVLTLENELLKQYKCFNNNCSETLSDDPFIDRPCDKIVSVSEKENVLTSSPESESGKSYDNDNINDNDANYTAFENNEHEDEDALSLFAESITDLESSRVNASASAYASAPATATATAAAPASANTSLADWEEYVPLPRNPAAARAQRETFIYRPTKITNDNHSDDHSNTQLDPDQNDTRTHISSVKPVASHLRADASPGAPWVCGMNDRPRLIASMYKPFQGIKSSVFKGVCFFNLISGCKNAICRYRHVFPEPEEIERRLTTVSEDSFIQEYISLRAWPDLRRKYGLCFVNECDKRELTNVLVEMGIDFVAKADLASREDAELKVAVLEVVLMHLNRAPLEPCADLLRYTVQYAPFYHTLMKAIADTQNFSRFKPVFIKLSRFIVEAGGSFDIDTVVKILERVCILPFEKNLFHAMFTLIQNTDKKIYGNNMMKQFAMLAGHLEGIGGDVAAHPSHRSVTPRYSTPDNEHSVKATIATPTIIRTVDLKRVRRDTVLQNLRGKSVRREYSRWGPPAPPPPPALRQVSYGPTPFKRRPVPKF